MTRAVAWVLLCLGVLVGGTSAFVWVLAARELRADPHAGHFLLPFTLGAILVVGGSAAAAVTGVVLLVRGKKPPST